MTPLSLPYAVSRVPGSRVTLEVASAGDAGRPAVILLHGFPDLWQGWHFQIPVLAGRGFRVLAPNLRGYGQSDKPAGIASYDIDDLAGDVIALADGERLERFCLVGHDWGGIIAWWTAARFPERISRLVILNAPHPGIFHPYALTHPTQFLRSWYVGFFQLPLIPEALLAAGNFELLFQAVKRTSLPGIFDASDRRYLAAGWSQPGALTAMLNYYRAIARRSSRSLQAKVDVPTLVLFGAQDPAEEVGLARESVKLCRDARLEIFESARHWIQREEHERVTAALLRFLAP